MTVERRDNGQCDSCRNHVRVTTAINTGGRVTVLCNVCTVLLAQGLRKARKVGAQPHTVKR